MALTVTMPQLGESVTEGTIARWLKHPGDAIAKYESIAEVITDKVNAEIPAPADGVMSELIAPEGTVVPVGQPICSIDTGDGASAAAAEPAAQATAAVAAATAASSQAAPAEPQRAVVELHAAPAEAEVGGETALAPIQDAFTQPASDAPASDEAAGGNGQAGGYHVTPAVRMLVREHGVDLSKIAGSGIGGRISKKDVLEYVQRRDAAGGSSGAARTPAGVPAPATPPAMSPTQAPQPALSVAPGHLLLPLSRPPSLGLKERRWCRFRRFGRRLRSTWFGASRRRRMRM